MLRLGLSSRCDLDDVAIVGHVAVGDVDDRARAPLTLPRAQLDPREIGKVELLVNFHPFFFEPCLVTVELFVLFKTVLGSLCDFHVGAKHYHGSYPPMTIRSGVGIRQCWNTGS